jgi:putative phosphoribosyl transferase
MTEQLQRPFRNRQHAGQALAKRLAHYHDRSDVVVLGLPRGGVPVAFEVAEELQAFLDVFVVRKLGVPWHRELAMGAIASGGVLVLNDDVVTALHITQDVIDQAVLSEQRELERRERLYRDDRPFPSIADRIVILVDDGLATGSSMRAAVRALREHQPRRIVIGVPVAAADTCEAFRREVDEVICAVTPEPFHAVGLWYQDFDQTTDEEVRELLGRRMQEVVKRGT